MESQHCAVGSFAARWQGLAVSLAGRSTYRPVWELQRKIWERRRALRLPDTLLLLEHHPVITLGRHGDVRNLVRPGSQATLAERDPRGDVAPPEVVRVDRGGDVTYHGPGQLTVYFICDLRAHDLSVRDYVAHLEGAVIAVLESRGIRGQRRVGLTGVWVWENSHWAKIAALGVRVARHVSYHGIALNVGDCLDGFATIVPCGLPAARVTTLARHAPGADIESISTDVCRAIGERLAIEFRPLRLPAVADQADLVAHLAELDGAAHRIGRRPPWLRVGLPGGETFTRVRRVLAQGKLHTVCESARCPNRHECWNSGTATFLILGDRCTRRCRFCAIAKGSPAPPDLREAQRLVAAAERLDLQYLVVTSVTRDDLPDGGAAHFAAVIGALRRRRPQTSCEVLIPDFGGDQRALDQVIAARPTVLNHNVETVPRLYEAARPGADFGRSLAILQRSSAAGLCTKSGFMVGLGESDHEIAWLLRDLRQSGCGRVTIGQYLQPTREQLPVKRFVTPEEFARWRQRALDLGFEHVAAGPLVRSSYRAAEGLGATLSRMAGV